MVIFQWGFWNIIFGTNFCNGLLSHLYIIFSCISCTLIFSINNPNVIIYLTFILRHKYHITLRSRYFSLSTPLLGILSVYDVTLTSVILWWSRHLGVDITHVLRVYSCVKSSYAYEHYHTGMGFHTFMVNFFDTIQASLNIVLRTVMVRV